MPVASQFCICKSVSVMSVLCGLNTSVAFLGAQLNLAGGPVMPRLGGDAAGCGAAQPACLRARPPARPPLPRPQPVRCRECLPRRLHNRTGRTSFRRVEECKCVSIFRPAPPPASLTLRCVSATLLLPVSSTADVAHSRLRKVMNCVVCAA